MNPTNANANANANNANCLIIAGEKSGEEHCLSFFRDLKKNCPGVDFWGVGGDQMIDDGFDAIFHLKDFSDWGFGRVLLKIFFYFKCLRKIIKEIEKRQCKAAILIDYQGFNLYLAQRLGKKGVKILYYIAPQAWAWKEWRTKIIRKSVHTLFTIIPFEKEWFKERGVGHIIGVPHPLLQKFRSDIETLKRESLDIEGLSEKFQKKVRILLLPGSRNSEVYYLLPEFWKVIRELRKDFNVETLMVKSSNVKGPLYSPYESKVDFVYTDENLAEALRRSDVCLASAGTVTLVAALFQVPTIACYKFSPFDELILKIVINNYTGWISLANIIHQKEIFPEFYQDRVNTYNIRSKVLNWLRNIDEYNKLKNRLAKTKEFINGDKIHIPSYMGQVIKSVY